VRRGAVDAMMSQTNDVGVYGQGVWSCPLDAGVKFAEIVLTDDGG
jgi:hypothetical protein